MSKKKLSKNRIREIEMKVEEIVKRQMEHNIWNKE